MTRSYYQRSTSTHSRRGISLLEVLISMFVLLIGLTGIAALLPAGRSEIIEGVKVEYGMMVGRNAMRELVAKDFLKPCDDTNVNRSNWFDADGTPIWDLGTFVGTGWTNAATPFAIGGGTDRPFVVIDPTAIYANATYTDVFPTNAGTFSLRRISPYFTKSGGSPVTHSAMADNLGRATADLTFRCSDDLELIPSADGKLPPTQRTNSASARSSVGNYTWLATVVPDPGSGVPTENMIVSVAVMHKRDLSDPTTSEDALPVTFPAIQYDGSGNPLAWGGEASFTPRRSDRPMRPGRYVMLAGTNTTTNETQVRWYRVMMAGEIDPTTGTQRLTLGGIDWGILPRQSVPNEHPCQIWIVDNVIAVYEKQLSLDLGN